MNTRPPTCRRWKITTLRYTDNRESTYAFRRGASLAQLGCGHTDNWDTDNWDTDIWDTNMRPTKIDRNRVLTLAALFNKRQQDYKSLEQALEDGDLPGAQHALARCREANQKIAGATGVSSSSAVGLLGTALLKTDLSVWKEAFQTGEVPNELTGGAAQKWYQRALDDEAASADTEENRFIQDLFTVLQAAPLRCDTDENAAEETDAPETSSNIFHFYTRNA